MESRLAKWGNSLGLRIPKSFAQQIGLKEGSPVEIQIVGNSIILTQVSFKLEDLLAQITPENIQSEIKSGKRVGKEIW